MRDESRPSSAREAQSLSSPAPRQEGEKKRRRRPKKVRSSWFGFGGKDDTEAGRGASSEKKKPRRSPSRSTRVREWKILACLLAVCALAAFLFVAVQRITIIDAASFFLFGTSDPYISPERELEMQKELKEMIQKQFGARKGKGE